jgi:hypothetical membrane protein
MSARPLAWLAIAVQPLFVALWIVGGALQPHYSHLERDVSDLGSAFAHDPWIVNAGILLLGLSVIALAPGLRRVLPRSRAAAALFALAGLGFAAMAFLPIDCSFALEACRDRFRAGDVSWQTQGHVWIGLAAMIVMLATPFALARALWRRPAGIMAPAPIASAALAAGLAGLLIAILAFALQDAGGDGVNERLQLLALHAWIVLVAVGILHSTSAHEAPGDPVPMSPRQFFGSEWSGAGEVALRPLWLYGRFPRRWRFRRSVDWVTDELCVVSDHATFANGTQTSRRLLCGFVEPGRAEVTTLDPPHAVSEIHFDDDGYRVAPYELAVPFGPISVTVRCHDRHRIEPDGTLVDTIDALFLGVPVARATLRARLTDGDGAQAAGDGPQVVVPRAAAAAPDIDAR